VLRDLQTRLLKPHVEQPDPLSEVDPPPDPGVGEPLLIVRSTVLEGRRQAPDKIGTCILALAENHTCQTTHDIHHS